MIPDLEADRYRPKREHFEKIFAGEVIDRGGHWKEQPLSPEAKYFAFLLKEKFGEWALVLDEGSGTGGHTLQLANLGLRVIGIEQTASGAAKSNALRRQADISPYRASFVHGDIRFLPFKDGSFSGFHDWCSLSHLHRRDWKDYFNEAARVTVKGGLGLILGFSGYDREFYGVPIREDGVAWLEFRDGQVFLENRHGEKYNRPHDYPEKYENMSWWFARINDIKEAAGDNFDIRGIRLSQHPEAHHKGKRHYLNILLERR
ncbi:class I SAM-dependent methyltransferase [Candidatus Microgenomates bacterium]|nr:class I SAM-dependent methyltransferase [Candidatus Microgenomates bacterium]